MKLFSRINPALVISLLSIFMLLNSTAGASADPNWPQWRGPGGQGISTEKNLPTEWSATKNIKWKTPIAGRGHSSPVVWGKRLFLQTASKDGSDRSLVCVDTDKGEIAWKKSIPAHNSSKHDRNSLASSTPATDGERVYCFFWDAKNLLLYAYDL